MRLRPKRLWPFVLLALVVTATVVLSQPNNTRRLMTETSVIENTGAALGIQVVAGGAHELIFRSSGLIASLGLGVGATTNLADQSCIGRDASTDRLFANKDCDEPAVRDAGEEFLDGRFGSQQYSFTGSDVSHWVANRCLTPGANGGILWTCNVDNNFRETVLSFPTGKSVRVNELSCIIEQGAGSVGEGATVAVRYRDASDHGGTNANSTATLTVLLETDEPEGTFGHASTTINEVCPYASCALGLRLTAETITTGISTNGLNCTLFYEMF